MKKSILLAITLLTMMGLWAPFNHFQFNISNNNNNSSATEPSNNDKPNNNNNNNSNNSNTNIPSLSVDEMVENELNSMSLDEKIAQMLIVSFNNTDMNNFLKTTLNYNPGGIILFKNNITTFARTSKLISDSQNLVNVPLFVSIDQEGGRVQRITNLSDRKVATIPSMWDVGKTMNADYAYTVGRNIAKDIVPFGINMDFAPVLDVVSDKDTSTIGDRSFGTDYKTVANMGVSLANGLQKEGIIPVYKHFPGHGSTITDSHYDLPVLTKTKDELLNEDLIPFVKAIQSGASIIMVGHLAIPNIANDNTPASLSKEIISGLLKQELGFKGLVVTDALNMGSLTKNYSEKEIYIKAIDAGVDILLMPKSVNSAITYIKEGIKEGKISEKQINNSVRKILKLKADKLNAKF